jgi:hypothetical protein
VSLILEALKKLEREKQSPDRGFLVLGPGAWSQAPGGRRRMTLALVGAVLLGAVAGSAFWRLREPATPRPTASVASPEVAGALPAPAASLVPPALPSAFPLLPAAMPPTLPPVAAPSGAPPDDRVVVPESPTAEVGAAREPPGQPAEPAATPMPATEPRFRLEAISRRDGRLLAVLSGRLVYEGDSFEDVHVLRIGEAEVELEINGRRVVIGF